MPYLVRAVCLLRDIVAVVVVGAIGTCVIEEMAPFREAMLRRIRVIVTWAEWSRLWIHRLWFLYARVGKAGD